MFSTGKLMAIVALLTSALFFQSYTEKHECLRDCEWPPEPRTCVYYFSVEWNYANDENCNNECSDSHQLDGNSTGCSHNENCIFLTGAQRPVLLVNKSLPGPSIQVCEGDTIIVHVTNNMEDMDSEGTTIHWHGMHQVGTPYMDGAPMVSQCPILIHQTFTYKFKASPAGTHWWHSHSGIQRSEGLFGPTVVRQAAQADPNSHLYDFDLPEHIVMVHDWLNTMVFPSFSYSHHIHVLFVPDTILMNGKGEPINRTHKTTYFERAVFNVDQGQRYRFRVISSANGYCQLQLSVDHHTLKVVATDGRPIEPFDTTVLVLHNAERFDFVLNADKKIENYWIRVKGVADCGELDNFGIIHYHGAPEKNPTDYEENLGNSFTILNACQTEFSANTVGLTDLKPAEPEEMPPNVDVVHYIGLEIDHIVVPRSTFSNLEFKMPSSPLQSQWRDVNKDDFCHIGNYTNCKEQRCSCINTIRVKANQVVELVFMNEGGILKCHPIHIHGHYFHVVAQQFLPEPITFREFMELDRNGLIPRKLNSTIVKDTVHVPQHGYLIVRFIADNPGWWLLHCHTLWHSKTGMMSVIHSGDDVPVPAGFPKCGSWSGADLMLPSLSATMDGAVSSIDGSTTDIPETSSNKTILVLFSLLTLISLGCIIYAVKFRKNRNLNAKNTAPDTMNRLQNESTHLL